MISCTKASVVVMLLMQIVFAEENCPGHLCSEIMLCNECIQFHHCCNWCFDEVYILPRCNSIENLKNCTSVERNGRSIVFVTQSKELKNVDDETMEAVQIKPQKIKLQLRKGDPAKFKITYRLAKNYPLDLYYLMDLTYTMSRDVATMTKIGGEMAQVLHTLTKNHRVAFGAYSDKVALPYYDTLEGTFDNPCSTNDEICEPGFDFRHHLNFTKNIKEFVEKTNNTKTTANLDNLEGAFDALMQIMVCHGHMNWMVDSRKIILVATDGILHMAGDGLLAGATKRNVDKCLLDAKSDYANKSLIYDYPSLEEIYRKLLQTKMNVVFAVKKGVRSYYEHVRDLIPEVAYLVELEEESKNIINVVKEGYHNFIKNVRFTVNTSHAPELDVQFESTCNTRNLNQTSSCFNVKEGEEYVFDVTINLAEHPANNKMGETLTIEEKSIREIVSIEIDYIGSKCQCKRTGTGTMVMAPNWCNSKGEWKCNHCNCYDGWTGPNCTLQCHKTNPDSCRKKKDDYISSTCFSRGTCECGRCICDNGYSGKYCEYQCPLYQNLVCANHGRCIKGECICGAGYVGDDCSCPTSNEKCIAPGETNICKGRGSCQCGKCICEEGFYGVFCEKCSQCKGLCSTYEECVTKKIDSQTGHCTTNLGQTSYKIKIIPTNGTITEEDEDVCYVRFETENLQTCEIYYKYLIEKDSTVKFLVNKNCWHPIKPAATASIVIGSIVGLGILIIIIFKMRLMCTERREYKRFEKETQMQREQLALQSEVNPIFKPATTSYEIPLEMQLLGKSKSE